MNDDINLNHVALDHVQNAADLKNFYEEMQNSIDTAAGRNLVDQIVEPKDIRRYLIGALEILYTKREQAPARKHASKL